MPNYIFITLVIFSPWLLFFAIMFYYAAISDKTFSFFITKKSQIFSYVGIIIGLGLLVYYIFISRLNNINKVINLYVLKDKLVYLIDFLTISDIIILGLFIIFMLLGWWSTLNWLYICLRRRLLALHLYFYQFKLYSEILSIYINIKLNFLLFSVKRVLIFTKSEKVIEIANIIWPHLFLHMEKTLFRFFMLYLLLYDVLLYHGEISIIFEVLPWFYIYFILRTIIAFIDQTHTSINHELSFQMYLHYSLK